jgi:uncharacterized membrane protein YkoI
MSAAFIFRSRIPAYVVAMPRKRIFLHLVAAFLFSLAVLAAGAVQAAEPRVDHGVDHDRARAAVQSGEIMALHDILARVHKRYQGRVLEVVLRDQEEGLHGWVYEIRMFTPEDAFLVLRVDAGTATILKIERGKIGAAENGTAP